MPHKRNTITLSLELPEGAMIHETVEALKARRDFYQKTGRIAEAQHMQVIYLLAKGGKLLVERLRSAEELVTG